MRRMMDWLAVRVEDAWWWLMDQVGVVVDWWLIRRQGWCRHPWGKHRVVRGQPCPTEPER